MNEQESVLTSKWRQTHNIQFGRKLIDIETALVTRFNEFHALAKITAKINEGAMLGEVLEHIYDSFRSFIPYDRLGFAMLNEQRDTVHLVWARSERADLILRPGYSAPLKGSSLEILAQTGCPRIINDLELYLKENPHSESTKTILREGIRSSLTCPLLAAGKPVGLLFFSSNKPSSYNTDHEEFFLQIAGELAFLVEKCLLYQRIIEITKGKYQLLGLAVHDLRGPLCALQGYVRLFQNGSLGDLRPLQKEVIQSMGRASDTVLNLLNEVLDVSQLEGGHLTLRPTETDIQLFLKDCVKDGHLLAAEKSIELKLDTEGLLGRIYMDAPRIRQVLDNLISNAIKYSKPNTTISISATIVGESVVISVSDQGKGIPDEELSNLFKPFGRTSTNPTGGEQSTGLGLVIVKRIVEAHGGTVLVESQVNVGSKFSFSLPTMTPVINNQG